MGEHLPSMLIVDDEPSNRRLLERYLRGEGYRVRCACDGPEALELARQEAPDVVLLDVMMPGMTGYEVCEELKTDPACRLSQVMLVTALDSMPDRVVGLDTGADDYISKPVRRAEFLAKVRALLRARRLLLELEGAREAIAARNAELELKKTLAETLVHDLKGPLSMILGNLDLLEMRAGEPLQPLIDRSKQGAKRMRKMILDLLDVEKLEQGRLEPELEQTDASMLIHEALEDAELPAASKDVKLKLDAPHPTWVRADAELLRRVVDNLVANAVKHSPRDGQVEVSLRQVEGGVEIVVADEGPGVPEQFRDRIFEKYGRVDDASCAGTSNRGLGLTFCRLAVEAHGGRIHIADSCSGGASFHAWMPAMAGTSV